jgi:transcriptional regulator of arginine metabolism
MKNKRNRLKIISDILRSSVVGSQEELLKLLKEQHCEITQATLSRDLKVLKVAKTHFPMALISTCCLRTTSLCPTFG